MLCTGRTCTGFTGGLGRDSAAETYIFKAVREEPALILVSRLREDNLIAVIKGIGVSEGSPSKLHRNARRSTRRAIR